MGNLVERVCLESSEETGDGAVLPESVLTGEGGWRERGKDGAISMYRRGAWGVKRLTSIGTVPCLCSRPTAIAITKTVEAEV